MFNDGVYLGNMYQGITTDPRHIGVYLHRTEARCTDQPLGVIDADADTHKALIVRRRCQGHHCINIHVVAHDLGHLAKMHWRHVVATLEHSGAVGGTAEQAVPVNHVSMFWLQQGLSERGTRQNRTGADIWQAAIPNGTAHGGK